MARLEDLTVGAAVKGLRVGQVVTVVAATWHGRNTVNVVYRDEMGGTHSDVLFRDAEPSLEISEQTRPWSFDASPESFKLGLEAYRINLASLFDPTLAVHTSLVEPLPHQIMAVYGSMLRQQPLRFLLADDPGAGKTIMAGLLIKELIIRGDLQRCLIICPGSLGEQWQDELFEKFNLEFELATNDKLQAARSGNWFNENDRCIGRIDKLARNEDCQNMLEVCEWDLVIVDEAHKMSATYFGGDAKYTKRYRLGQLVSGTTRHFLLMTATPHNGKEQDFQLFMALLDGDRFEGRFRDGAHVSDARDLMRRMTKEQLLRFDGSKLFPERVASTIKYELSDEESALYAAVTDYVKNEFNRAAKLEDGRKGTVGFALTILQRRLASSPDAIYQSLLRRRERLESQLREARELKRGGSTDLFRKYRLPNLTEDDLDDMDDLPEEEMEELEAKVINGATSAQTIAELELEIQMLQQLEAMADSIRRSGRDTKWSELSALLQDNPEMFTAHGQRRKLVIFTEHKDTLQYLHRQIESLLGNPEAIVIIRGGMGREQRRNAEEAFRSDPDVAVLLATDAAGEGINLQRGHLMVNYDLPWNPNRLEQRFGRIHRIGQTEVCHLWNLVAHNTREGDVYVRLLDKLDAARQALGGSVFDVLGRVFEGHQLRQLMIDAVRYGDSTEVKTRLLEKVDNAASQQHIRQLIEDEALSKDSMDVRRVQKVREDMERRELMRLQPHYIKQFFEPAFASLGGKLSQREPKLYEIRHVPAVIRARDRQIGRRAPVQPRYERLTFDKTLASSKVPFICPGHPLLDATLDVVLEQNRSLLRQGAVLIDPIDLSEAPKALVVLEHTIRDNESNTHGTNRVISREAQFVTISEDGQARQAGFAPHIDYDLPTKEELQLVKPLLDAAWLRNHIEDAAKSYALQHIVPEHRQRVESERKSRLEKTRVQVKRRLLHEINHWDNRAQDLKLKEKSGKQPKMNSIQAQRRAEDLQARLDARLAEIDRQLQLSTGMPSVQAGAFVVPRGLMNKLKREHGIDVPDGNTLSAADTATIDRLAVEAVIAAERKLGREPIEMPHNNPGFDIESFLLDEDGQRTGEILFIEVKGKTVGKDTVTISSNQINYSLNKPEHFLLAIVPIENGLAAEPRYVRQPFQQSPESTVRSINYELAELLVRSTPPC